MTTRLLVTNAGSGASNNLIRSLRAGDPSFGIVGCHDDQFVLRNSAAERNYLVPSSGHSQWVPALRGVLATERIDLLIPTTDGDVTAVSRVRAKLRGHLFLPGPAVIALCADKYRLAAFLRTKGVAVPATHVVSDLKQIDDIFRRLGRPSRAWCRIRSGAGAMGAIPVGSPEQARSWIRYWRDMRGVPIRSFTLSEYLPGRDFGCQSLWKDGRLVLIKTYERLSYLGRGSHPGQVSSVAALGKTVLAPQVMDASVKAIRVIDPKASGVFGVDLKADSCGVPCITEINAGRFSSATNIFDLTGKYNMAATFVRLARGEPVDLHEEYDVADDYYMLRGLDTVPHMFHADEFFDGIQDARPRGRAEQLPDGPR
jgi:carbamoyl-phosphate synthase large subunit